MSDDHDLAPLLDVTQIPLGALLASDDSNLSRCIQRIVKDLDDPHGVCAGFDSFVSDS